VKDFFLQYLERSRCTRKCPPKDINIADAMKKGTRSTEAACEG